MNERDWEARFSEASAFWRHGGSLEQPFARLASGKISDGFFNGGKVQENDPALLGVAARTLYARAGEATALIKATRVIGAAEGGIYLAARIAEVGRLKSAYAVPTTPKKEEFEFARQDFDKGEELILCEDTITTGGTLEKLHYAARMICPTARFAPIVLALCNRSGKDFIGGKSVISLIRPSFQVWEEGCNPYTPNGKEVVEPVRPKGREEWALLNRQYV